MSTGEGRGRGRRAAGRETRAILPLIEVAGEITSPPFSDEARNTTYAMLRLIRAGESIGMPRSRSMSDIGPRCHELRIPDGNRSWRVFYHIDPGEAIVVLGVLAKKTQTTPKRTIKACQNSLARYMRAKGEGR